MHIIHVKILENMRNFRDHSITDDYTTFVLMFFFTITQLRGNYLLRSTLFGYRVMVLTFACKTRSYHYH